jgi:GT2 family glycosyltransferase
MSYQNDVSIILVNYNTKEITTDCIRSIFQNTKGIKFEIIVVDNNSSDGSVEYLKREFNGKIKLIKSDVNLGFGGGANIGIKESTGKYVLLLNTDTVILDNTIKNMFDFMEGEENKDVAVIGVVLIDENGNALQSYGEFLPFKVGINEFIFKAFLPKKLNRAILKNEKVEEFKTGLFQNKRFVEVDYIIGADMFIRKDVIDEVGVFDERFFMYFEEADLQLRMKKRGYKIGLIKDGTIIHLESKSFKVSNNKRTMKMVSFLRYLRKNFLIVYTFYKPFSLVYALMKLFVDTIKRDYSVKENMIFLKSILGESYPTGDKI